MMDHKNDDVVSFSDEAKRRVKQIIDKENAANKSVYLVVEGGGCAGVECRIEFKDKLESTDVAIFNSPEFILYSNGDLLDFIRNMTINFTSELVGSKFVFIHPKAKDSCSCGKSFSLE